MNSNTKTASVSSEDNPSKNLQQLLSNMKPKLHDGEYVFCTISAESEKYQSVPLSAIVCEMKEEEGATLVIRKEMADTHALSYSYVSSWITLQVHSSLEAVGLTAAFSTALGKEGISANVIAGYYHDHIFVGTKEGPRAVRVLQELAVENKDMIHEK